MSTTTMLLDCKKADGDGRVSALPQAGIPMENGTGPPHQKQPGKRKRDSADAPFNNGHLENQESVMLSEQTTHDLLKVLNL